MVRNDAPDTRTYYSSNHWLHDSLGDPSIYENSCSNLFGSRVQSHINDLSFAGSAATLDQFINEEPCQVSEPNLSASIPGQLLGHDGGVLDFDKAEIAEPGAMLSAFSRPGRIEFGVLESSDGSNVGHNATDQAVTPVSAGRVSTWSVSGWVCG